MPPQPPDSLPGSDPEREESTFSRSLPFPSPEVIREFADPRNVRDLLHMADPAHTIILKARFGEIPPDAEMKVNAANAETLDRWLAMAATAGTLEEALA